MQGLKLFIGIGFLLNNQQTNAQTPRPIPAQYSSTTTPVNYVRTWDATAPEKDPNALMGKSLKDVKQTTQYIDGLGRPLQTVIKQGSLVTDPSNPASSANARDMVSPVEYDAYGREQHKYLPYAESLANDGLFKYNTFFQQAAFYNDPNGLLKGQGETFFYSKTNFEASPLNKVTETYAPGNSWVGSETNVIGKRKNVQIKYSSNTVIDAVRIWKVQDNSTLGEFGSYTTISVYPAGELNKTITIDEHKKQVIEFEDKDGRVILKKVQLTATADDGSGSDYPGWLSTFYIYDDFGNLRCVIQPSGVKALQPGWSFALKPALLDEQCFRYEYDQRNRMVKKKVPGAAPVSMVYDARDRMVLSQDGSLALQGKWMYTTYDELNRPVTTGLWSSGLTWAQHRGLAAGSTNYPVLSGEEELTRTFYNDYSWLSNYGSPLSGTYNTTYDTYFQTVSNTNWPYAQANVQSRQIRGLATGTRVKILGTVNSYLYTANIYDDKGRIIQIQSTNITGGTDINTMQYTWAGQPLIVIQKQEKQGANAQTTVAVSEMTYDDLGRLTKTRKKVSNTLVRVNNQFNGMPDYKITAQNEYNALGQVKRIKLSPDYNSGAGLEAQNYDYNIRGWLLGVNRDYTKDGGSDNYFGFDLGYDKANNNIIGGQTYNNPQYNGNIEGMVWKSKGDNEKRRYDFAYDAVNRLLKADFTQYTNSAFNQNAGVNFNVKMGNGTLLPDGSIDPTTAYDDNGNILQMQQYGLKLNNSIQIDNLKYTYIEGTNRLKSVTDFNNAPDTKLGDFKTNLTHPKSSIKAGLNPLSTPAEFDAITDYNYDVNGNLNLDNNKAITGITYNHLNLPQVITVLAPSTWVNGSRTITYVYDATGNKLQKVVYESMGPSSNRKITTTYINGIVYESKLTNQGGTPEADDYTDVLQFIPQEEGRIRFKPAVGTTEASLQYDYMLKDHLGNVRMVLTDEQKIDTYPAATMELASATNEELIYSNLNTTRIDKPAGYPVDNTTTPNDKVAKTNGSGNKIGPSIVLKVMAGDKFNIKVSSWYKTNGVSPQAPNSPLADLVTALINGVSGVSSAGGHAVTNTELQNSGVLTPGATQFLGTQTPVASRPKAYLNWILFDEQFKFVESSSGAEQVPAETVFGTSPNQTVYNHVKNDLPINKNGYLYVYVSNETPNIDVFFDNLQVTHKRGAILEETHYYPFGLTMAGISSKAAGGIENKHKFNDGTELENKDFVDGSGLDLYATEFRSYDAQIGRFHQVDALGELNFDWSSYTFSQNNPILFNDPYGLDTLKRNGDGTFPTVRPDNCPLQTGDVIVNPGNDNVYFNGESWQKAKKLDVVNLVCKPKIKNSVSSQNSGNLSGADLANRIIQGGRVSFNSVHPAPPNPRFRDDLANADDNIRDAAAGLKVHTSVYGNAKGVLVVLNPRLLRLLDGLSQNYTLEISELAGAKHSSNSRHYAGIAMDITKINGKPVSSKNPYYRQLMEKARQMGATEVLGPGSPNHGSHIHIAMSRQD